MFKHRCQPVKINLSSDINFREVKGERENEENDPMVKKTIHFKKINDCLFGSPYPANRCTDN